jgi:hypothetical protein
MTNEEKKAFNEKTKKINEAKTVAELIALHKEFRSKQGAKKDFSKFNEENIEDLRKVLHKLIAPKETKATPAPVVPVAPPAPVDLTLVEFYDVYEIEHLDLAIITIQKVIETKLQAEIAKHEETATKAKEKAESYKKRLHKK